MNAYDVTFPIVAGKSSDKALHLENVVGTTFKIGKDLFITAAHVLKTALDYELMAIGYVNADSHNFESEIIVNYQIFEELDIAVFESKVERAKQLNLVDKEQDLMYDIMSIGYPYAHNIDMNTIDTRGFKGHITSKIISHQFTEKPKVYELSFQCPKGLSGAPLISTNGRLNCFGIILGNSVVEMPLFEEHEVIDDKSKIVYEKTQVMYLGLALQSSVIRKFLLNKGINV